VVSLLKEIRLKLKKQTFT